MTFALSLSFPYRRSPQITMEKAPNSFPTVLEALSMPVTKLFSVKEEKRIIKVIA